MLSINRFFLDLIFELTIADEKQTSDTVRLWFSSRLEATSLEMFNFYPFHSSVLNIVINYYWEKSFEFKESQENQTSMMQRSNSITQWIWIKF